ncbi:related to flavin-nucleotide-binding protein [Fusarium fujikuroi]|uniref:Related to flavin-nucleotide-binding protein n=1 Tax=Gibberella fujikuroi (strain CBS 195.34 / IMI 58289 / NRRL A-6831) TaxID=1279085 RepID=S0EF09_GIBF5|nr:related to flavin-nucleotide-binding protein [Fusarium fujikuroi IMI 58289]KLO81560.1 flavin-nucleotide-binding protein [Fusarium fujikuroi]KLO87987.1 flavin-nucleotide-binding protein [Fusarium fujikuroi]KLP13760.1 flavin-nucleotide-binding protein [Fusarium fujikuroi]CCT70963.1 related to flavin-nucleotide-binding protein [Fusarium fujikuroi IMI 58289]SCN96666.1 related to flavin-nucleotide-binding protein [Fusarium fujikuroi]
MGRHNLQYPKDSTNTIKRYKVHGVYDLETVHSIVNTCPILHVSFNTPSQPFPVVLPMIGQLGSFDRPSSGLRDPLELYLHGYVSSRIMNLAQTSTVDGEEIQGMPVCVAASHVDGLVLTLATYSHNYNYRSAVIYGYATTVKSDEEKLYAMELISNSVVADRWNHTRQPPLASEMQSTNILKIKITSASAKISAGSTTDDKSDLENESLVNSTWTGVLPVYQTIGEPIPGPYNKVEVPEHVASYAKDTNDEKKQRSLDAAKGERRAT